MQNRCSLRTTPTDRKSMRAVEKGFTPIEMLTTDRETFRCYNWLGEDG
ncbi:hypothetical protein [Haladaptatus sp. DFWS20]